MAYLGNSSTSQAFVPAVDYFTADGATSSFTLSRPVASVAQVEVVVNNVVQNPSDAFTVNGNTLTFTSVPAAAGSNNVYVKYTSPVTQVIAPSDATVGTAALAAGAVTAAKLGTGAAVANIGARALGGSQLPAGTVLQVVQAYTGTQVTLTTNTQTATGLTATITPTSATSKILVVYFQNGIRKVNDTGCGVSLFRNSTELGAASIYAGYTSTATNNQPGSVGNTWLDSPATTSAVTYSTKAWSTANISMVQLQVNAEYSSITLMEIAA